MVGSGVAPLVANAGLLNDPLSDLLVMVQFCRSDDVCLKAREPPTRDSLAVVLLEWLAIIEVRRCGNKRSYSLQWRAFAQAQ